MVRIHDITYDTFMLMLSEYTGTVLYTIQVHIRCQVMTFQLAAGQEIPQPV